MTLPQLAGALLAVAVAVSTPSHAACTFSMASPIGYAAGTNAGDVATGFFNADGHLDAAVVNRQSSNVRILLGAGNGSFVYGSVITTDWSQGDIIAGDINGDGKTDLAIAIPWSNNFTVKPHVKTLLGDGNGTFTPVAFTDQMLIWQNPHAFAAGDFNKDGRMDAVVTKSQGQISALVAIPSGFLVQKGEYTTLEPGETGGVTGGITAGDFDADGNLDVAVAEWIHDRVRPFYGVGDGSLTVGTAIPLPLVDAGHDAEAVAAGDLDGDGDADLVMMPRDPYGGTNYPPLHVALSNGASRTFAAPYVALQPGVAFPSKLLLRDMNADGDLDLVLGHAFGVDIYPGNGNGTFGAKTNAASDSLGLAVADVDNNGSPDLLSTAFTGGLLVVSKNGCAQATLQLTSSANPVSQGVPFTVTATLVAPSAGAVPTGTLTLRRNATELSSASLATSTTTSASSTEMLQGTYEYTATYSGDANYVASTKTLRLPVQAPPFGPPPGLNAISFGGAVSLTWVATRETARYEIFRSSGAGFVYVGESTSPSYSDTSASPASAFVYKVRAINGGGAASDFGTGDLATTRAFTDELLVPGVTPFHSAHLTELRDAVNAARSAAGLPPVSLGGGGAVLASDVTLLRSAANQARTIIGIAPWTFSDPTLTPQSTPIRTTHFLELRSALR